MNTIEQLAEELHKFYRAAFKALTAKDLRSLHVSGHDHGWDHCNKKKYFLRRAAALLSNLTGEELPRAVFFSRNPEISIDLYSKTKITTEGLGHVGHD